MNEYLSGKCAHCGRKKEEHFGGNICNRRDKYTTIFLDSGLKLLHDRAPELLQAVREFKEMLKEVNPKIPCTYLMYYGEKLKALESIIGDILRPQP